MKTRAVRRVGVAALLLWAGAASLSARNRPHLLLITVDTLRADYLGCYGYDGDPTPSLDRLAEQGVLFEDALSVIGKTGPSFATAFSSLYPPSHGARRNGVQMRDDVPVLAEILAEQGYQTAAFITNWTLKHHLSGIGRGFEHYDEHFNLSRHGIGGARERDAKSVTEAAMAWLEQDRDPDRPLFLWVHYSEPHTPFELHPGHIPPQPSKEDRESGWQKRRKYASEVRFTDSWVGRLLEQTTGFLPAPSTFVVFFADHGESLGEHGYWGHGKNVHWPNLKVPLIFTGPGIPEQTRLSYPASLVDLLPTLLDLLELPASSENAGRTLVPAWDAGAGEERPRFALGEKHTAFSKKKRTRFAHPISISLQTQKAKAVYDFDDRKIQYFDLVNDPQELRPLRAPTQETRPPLGRQLSDWYKNLAKYEQRSGELSDEDRRQLESLGYLGGS